jgi:starvation-inducible DNA-binding protein
MRALHATPDGRSDTIAATTALPAFPAGEQSTSDVVRAVTAATTLRGVHDDVDAEDPTSADLLHAILEDLEKQAWMLAAEVRGT